MTRLRSSSITILASSLAVAALLQPTASADTSVAGPPITLRGTTSASSTSGAAVTVPRPVGVTEGDVLVARVLNRGHVRASLGAAGWTEVGSTHSAAMLKSVLLTRVASAAEPATYTFETSAPSELIASVSAFDHVDTADPVDSYAGTVNGYSGDFHSPIVRSRVGNTMALWFGNQLYSGGGCPDSLITPPGQLTEILDDCLGSTTGLAIDTAYAQLGAAGSRSGWLGSSAFPRTNVTQVLTLRPASRLQVADRYASAATDVGTLWQGDPDDRDVQLDDRELHEPSGMAASRVNPGVQYVHSEADVEGMVAIRSSDARVVGQYDVAIPQQWDWEDIATGPCPSGSCIFAGDIGRIRADDNPPSTFAVYRVAEPDVDGGQASGRLTGDWFRFRYPDAPHNAEALMVHPITGRIYVITKEPSGVSGIYAFPTTLPAPSATTVTTLTKVGTLNLPTWTGNPENLQAAFGYAQVTAASIHPAGDRFLVRTPFRVYEYRAQPGAGFESAFDAAPVSLTAPSERQGEAIEYAPDGSAYYTLSERAAPPFVLKRVDRR